MKTPKPIPQGQPVEGDMTVALDSRFLNAIVLQGALEKTGKQTLPVKIDRVEFHESLKYENGTTDKNVYLMYFEKSEKPLKLAKTNIKRVITMHGSIGKGWHGKAISLCLEDDRRPDLGGQKGPCVRVSLINPETGKPGAALKNHNPFNK
jgi:hypothetical protein